MFEGKAHVYILTNNTHTVLYTGVTTDIVRRIQQHKQKIYPKSFTSRYQCDKLIFFYEFDNICDAIETEKKIKKRNRDKKRSLIGKYNPNREDLFEKGDPSTRNLLIPASLRDDSHSVNLFEKGDPSTRNLIDSRLASGGQHDY